MRLESNKTTGKIEFNNIKYDDSTSYSNIHAVVRDKSDLDGTQGSIERNITKSINCVSIDWNSAKFTKLAETIQNTESLLYNDEVLNDIVSNGVKESSQLIYLIEKYAEALGTYLFYIGPITYTYTNSDNEVVEFSIDGINNDPNSSQILNSMIHAMKESNELTYSIRSIEDIYAPKTDTTIANNGNTYHIRRIPKSNEHPIYMICPESMFTELCAIQTYENFDSFIVDPARPNDHMIMQLDDNSKPNKLLFNDNGENYVIVGWGRSTKTLIFRDYNITYTPNMFILDD